jgi:predicted ATPase
VHLHQQQHHGGGGWGMSEEIRLSNRPIRLKRSEKPRLEAIHITGLKSIYSELQVELRPLTLLAGANSSGKSSAIQALLLLKQTLEAPYDPGLVLLSGPNVVFTKYDQVFSVRKTKNSFPLVLGLDFDSAPSLNITLHKDEDNKSHYLSNSIIFREEFRLDISECDNSKSLIASIESYIRHRSPVQENLQHLYRSLSNKKLVDIDACIANFINDLEKRQLHVIRNRFFLHPTLKLDSERPADILIYILDQILPKLDYFVSDTITDIIHLPGLRGNPERTYRETSVGEKFAGTFETYTASIIAKLAKTQPGLLEQLNTHLRTLELTSKIIAKKPSDAEVELFVNRTLTNGVREKELVSIADVGLGVSQVLPVLVALIVAKPGQLVYIEQPEIHLHPKAQVKLADIICAASSRGVIVVIETHSALLVRSIQTLIAKGEMDNEKAIFHWFTREKGETKVDSKVPDHLGRVGAWPEDFSDTELEAESRYLTEVQKRRGKDNGA